MARSLRLLRGVGIGDFTIVAGYRAEQYQRFARDHRDVRVVVNSEYASTGSMASFAAALDAGVGGGMLLLESDIIYEARALTAILGSVCECATLVSGPTGAGDEVWVDADAGLLRAMSKRRADLPSTAGEFVGITRLSAGGAIAMRNQFATFVAAHGHGRMDYETGALVAVSAVQPVGVVVVPDLQWGEIDDERHHARVSAIRWT